MAKDVQRGEVAQGEELLTTEEQAQLLKVRLTRLSELEKLPDFPTALWLGPRGKRRLRSELMAWALKQRGAQVGRQPEPLRRARAERAA